MQHFHRQARRFSILRWLLVYCGVSAFQYWTLLPAFADGESRSDEQSNSRAPSEDQSSENFKKTKRFLPGEEVVTTTGKEVRVWSTEGPVPVSKAPTPFEENSARVLSNTHIVVDGEALREKNTNRSGADHSESETVNAEKAKDTFAVSPKAIPGEDDAHGEESR